jgi:hypothetical protein
MITPLNAWAMTTPTSASSIYKFQKDGDLISLRNILATTLVLHYNFQKMQSLTLKPANLKLERIAKYH